jgi:hypothetical protein
VTLGDPRAAVRRRFAVFSTHGRLHMDYVCLKGIGIRIGYVSERAALILTANRFYALDGVRPGSSLAAARARLRLGAGIRLGPNTWYVASRPVANGVLKVNRGRVAEIGIALRSETSTPARARAFLSGFD